MAFNRLLFAGALMISNLLYSQTTLLPGDISFIAYQMGVTPSSPDRFAFVVLKDLEPGTIITFADKGVIATSPQTLCTNEDSCKWTSPNSIVSIGTVVTITESGTTGAPAVCNIGSATGALANLSSTGDQILAYQRIGGIIKFISAVSSSGFVSNCIQAGGTCTGMTNTTCLPTDLIGTSGYVAFPSVRANGYYSGSTSASSLEALITMLIDTANWTRTRNTVGAQTWPSPWSFSVVQSVGKEKVKNLIKIHPNPTSGITFVQTELEWHNAVIFNALGTKVLEIKNPESKEINLSDLANGMYFASFTALDGKNLGVYRVIKNK